MANRDKIRAVVARIIADPASWDQSEILKITVCGTTFCIAGHAAVLEGWYVANRWVQRLTSDLSDPEVVDATRVMKFAQDVLELEDWQADELFLWMPKTDEDGEGVNEDDFTIDALVDKIMGITGVDCHDILVRYETAAATAAQETNNEKENTNA